MAFSKAIIDMSFNRTVDQNEDIELNRSYNNRRKQNYKKKHGNSWHGKFVIKYKLNQVEVIYI